MINSSVFRISISLNTLGTLLMTMKNTLEFWFATGSQHLYGADALRSVAANSETICAALNQSTALPFKVVFKPVLTTPEAIRELMHAANSSPTCTGIIAWMHTFSPAKMWIGGLSILNKPLLHLHTQMSAEIPWASIDMDYMNLHQSAHGDREFGFINARLGRENEVIAGHWQNSKVQARIGDWMRVASAWHDWQGARFARFGDNMRQVAVTEGNKVSAEIKFGFSVNGYGIGDLVECIRDVEESTVDALCEVYLAEYHVSKLLAKGGSHFSALKDAARIELGLKNFLEAGGFKGFTTTFEDLHGIRQLPGLAVQRLMQSGFGFGAEGDWKTSALLRAIKVMAQGIEGGVSFMEDYTYHIENEKGLVLGAHMLEICPSIAGGQPSLEIHPLGIGGKEDPVRLVFDAKTGPALNISLIDLGNRFRLLVNTVETVTPPLPIPKLPVARVLWEPKPNFQTALEAWILAGGAHHTVYTPAVKVEQVEMFARMAGIECVVIDDTTSLRELRKELRLSNAIFRD